MAATASDISTVSMKAPRPFIRVKIPQARWSTPQGATNLPTSTQSLTTSNVPGLGPPIGADDIPGQVLQQMLHASHHPQRVDPLARYQPTRTTSVWEQLSAPELYDLVRHNLTITSELGTLRQLIGSLSRPEHINTEANFQRQLFTNVGEVGLPGLSGSPQGLSPFNTQRQVQSFGSPNDSSPIGIQYLDFADIDAGLDPSLPRVSPRGGGSFFNLNAVSAPMGGGGGIEKTLSGRLQQLISVSRPRLPLPTAPTPRVYRLKARV